MHNTLFTSQKSLPFSPAEVSSTNDQVRSGKEFDSQIGLFLRLPSSHPHPLLLPPPSPTTMTAVIPHPSPPPPSPTACTLSPRVIPPHPLLHLPSPAPFPFGFMAAGLNLMSRINGSIGFRGKAPEMISVLHIQQLNIKIQIIRRGGRGGDRATTTTKSYLTWGRLYNFRTPTRSVLC